MSPLTGRLRFKLRTLTNWIGVICVFIIVAVALATFAPPLIAWLGDFVAIPVLYFLLFQVLEKRTIWIVCNICEERIVTNRPWVCGDCGRENRDVDDFPFINRCGECRAI